MADWDMSIEEYIEERDLWMEEYGIDWATSEVINNDELDAVKYAKLKKLDKKKLVWTNHSTCEDDWWSPGFSVYGECQFLEQESHGCGCWQSHAYIIASKPWTDENERILATVYLPCPVCNADGEGEGVEGCEGPEIPQGIDGGECNDGFVNWYLD